MPTDRSIIKMNNTHEGLVEHECNAPPMKKSEKKLVRTFETGATRDSDDGKFDYEGFLSPVALERYAAYMHKHRRQSDGKLRASDNWQKGIPMDAYMKSMWRHFMDLWKIHRGYGPIQDPKTGELVTRAEALCAILFNAFGQLHEICSEKVIGNSLAKYHREKDGVCEEIDNTGDFQ